MPIFALVDCNNFFASCERVFNPMLEKKPIVVLSSNDGCVIARSNEAKALGIQMGSPYYQCRDICEKNKVYVFSSNFHLYGDMSDRVMHTLLHFCPEMEVYSIDEAFLQLDSFATSSDVSAYASHIRARVKQWTGIPVSIGIAPTKVLAKMANHLAKKNTPYGVASLMDPTVQSECLARFAVEDIWGVGPQTHRKLNALGIYNALQFRDTDPKFIRQHFGVQGEKILNELRGISCTSLETVAENSKNIRSSQSFGKSLTDYEKIAEALAHYTARACEKLRAQKSVAQGVYVFLRTSLFKKNSEHYNNGISASFMQPTNDTRKIITQAKACLKQIFRPGFFYKKTGIILLNLVDEHVEQFDLFSSITNETSSQLMQTIDAINHRLGPRSVFLAAQGTQQIWKTRCDRRSPRYTSCWEELVRTQK